MMSRIDQRMLSLLLSGYAVCALCVGWGVTTVSAQTAAAEPVAVTVRLRTTTGAPLAGERLTLVSFHIEDGTERSDLDSTCLTDNAGRCRWDVAPGLYELLSDRPLDAVSRVALAEGGLRGHGLTVGNGPITYHFVVHSDTRLYFDGAPQAAIPQPIIPTADEAHGFDAALAVETAAAAPPQPAATSQPAATLPPNDLSPLATPDDPASVATTNLSGETRSGVGKGWLVVIYIGLGLACGGTLHLVTRYGSRAQRAAGAPLRNATSTAPDATEAVEPADDQRIGTVLPGTTRPQSDQAQEDGDA